MNKLLAKMALVMSVVILLILSACAPAASETKESTSVSNITETIPATPSSERSSESTSLNASSMESISSLESLDRLDDIINAAKLESRDKSASVELYKIRYKSDDLEVVGYVCAPVDYLEQKYPVLIWNRGGNQEFGKLTEIEVTAPASAGFVVLASQYRGNDGGTGTEQFGGDDVNDVIKLIDISERFDFVQSGGVYMAGHSRGGMMTYIACKMDDRIKAAAVGAGISDSFAMYESRADMKTVYQSLVGGTPEIMPEEYIKRSAVRWADEINVPLLIVHGGEKDWRVDTSQAENMATQLELYGKEYKLIIYEDADHSLQNTDWYSEIVNWFHEHPLN